MKGVVGFEKDLVPAAIFVKLYFSVTKAEQARRFERRKNLTPLRQWKLSEVDIQAQDLGMNLPMPSMKC